MQNSNAIKLHKNLNNNLYRRLIESEFSWKFANEFLKYTYWKKSGKMKHISITCWEIYAKPIQLKLISKVNKIWSFIIFCAFVLETRTTKCMSHMSRYFQRIVKSWSGFPKTYKFVRNRNRNFHKPNTFFAKDRRKSKGGPYKFRDKVSLSHSSKFFGSMFW